MGKHVPATVETQIGGRTFKLETGKVAKLASGAVMCTFGETVVLATAVRANPRAGIDFFPLTCDYRERTAAAGKYPGGFKKREKYPAVGRFPGGFRKREGAPTEKEILTMRMIDRPIRPLFPEGFLDEIQLQTIVLSHDGQTDADVIACTAASAALSITDAPFQGPLATVRVGRIHTESGPQFVINPSVAQLEFSDLDLVLSGHKDGINMIEVGAAEISEADMLAAIRFGYDEGIKPLIDLINKLREACQAPSVRLGEVMLPSTETFAKVKSVVGDELRKARQITGKQHRNDEVDRLRKWMIENHFTIPAGLSYSDHMAAEKKQREAKEAFRILEKKLTHDLAGNMNIRPDGRGLKQIRPLDMSVGLLPRTHGSAFFQRGETQSVVTCVLGTI